MHKYQYKYTNLTAIICSVLLLFTVTACSKFTNSHGMGNILKPQKKSNIKYDDEPIHVAASTGNIEKVMSALLNGHIDLNTNNDNGRSLLLLAANKGHLELVVRLLQQPGIQVNTHDFFGSNAPLHIAAYHNHLEIVQELLAFPETDVNIKDNDNWTPLHLAVEKKNLKIVQELLKFSGADVNAIEEEKENTRINVNAINEKKQTPLHLAVKQGSIEIVKALLESPKTKQDIKDYKEKTPIDLAKNKTINVSFGLGNKK